MDKATEEIIISAFFCKNKQERVLHELFSTIKRKDVFWRLCHGFRDYINDKYIIEIPKPNSDFADIALLLKEHGAGTMCYVLSLNESVDGLTLPLLDGLKATVGFGLASIVSCIPGKLAYFEAEQSLGAPTRCLIKKL